MSLACRRLKAASVELGLRTGSGRLFQADGPVVRVGDVVRAVDFAQRNGDVSGWTVGRSERRGTEVHDRSDIDGPRPPA